MLTRLEVDGFKNLLGFVAEFGPFTCIAGANAVGKSNLFDAIEFLSLLADYPLDEAAGRVRAPAGGRTLARDLFWTDGERRAEAITLTADLIVEDVVRDELGRIERPLATMLRYHVKLGYENGGHIHRLVLLAERLSILREIAEVVRFPHGEGFVGAHHIGRIADPVILDAFIDNDGIAAEMNDGGTFSVVPTKDARRTLLSSATRAELPTLLAVREELRRWRRLALEPTVIAAPVKFGASDQLSVEGGNLPRVLDRLVNPPVTWGPDDPNWAELTYAKIVARISSLAPIQRIWVHEDADGGQLSIRAQLRGGEVVPARALSDGTLRFLALTVLALDPTQRLLCIEEPENGIHPAQVRDLVELLRDLSTDPRSDAKPPLRQVIVNTHSPLLVQAVCATNSEDMLLANTVTKSGPHQRAANVLHLAPLQGTWRCHDGVRGVGRVWLGSYSGRLPIEESP